MPPLGFSGPRRVAMMRIRQKSRGTSDRDRSPLREALMKLAGLVTAASLAVMLSAQPGLAQTKSGVDKLYILDCGQGVGPDQARWSPGVNVGKPLAISDNCYLIHHTQGWFLWDTGVADAIAAMPDGQKGEGNGPAWKRPKTL